MASSPDHVLPTQFIPTTIMKTETTTASPATIPLYKLQNQVLQQQQHQLHLQQQQQQQIAATTHEGTTASTVSSIVNLPKEHYNVHSSNPPSPQPFETTFQPTQMLITPESVDSLMPPPPPPPSMPSTSVPAAMQTPLSDEQGEELLPSRGRPVTDTRLESALDGQEPTVRNLILAAIGVMKNRKARPDAKRICNWIHRRYGRPMTSINEELEHLVETSVLARVDYKGSASYRILTPDGKVAKKRKRGIKPLGRTPSKAPVPLGMSNSNKPDISLRTLVFDLLGDPAANEGGATVTTKFISRAVEDSPRDIRRAEILGNLDLILEREVSAGHFVRTGPDHYTVPPTLPGGQRTCASDTLSVFMNSPPSATSSETTQDDDERRKNDLIQEKLSKLKSPSVKKDKKEPFYVTLREKRTAMKLQKRMQQLSDDVSGSGRKRKKKLPKLEAADIDMQNSLLEKMAKKNKMRKEHDDWMVGQEPSDGANSPVGPGRPGRKRKSRKIYDPADHDMPVRKRGAPCDSPVPPVLSPSLDISEHSLSNGISVSPPASPPELQVPMVKKEDVCMYCGNGSNRNKKGRPEALLYCKDCTTVVHPTCMDYTEELTRKILKAPWQCITCKTCSVCEEATDDECMLFCDSCDLGYHMFCHQPPVQTNPSGRWECFRCNPNFTIKKELVQYKSDNNTQQMNGHLPMSTTNGCVDETSKFLPLLPSQLHPHSGLLPRNWEDFPPDPEIPDVSEWTPEQIKGYFISNGLSAEHASVFVTEEIDGGALLLLHRTDVVSNLGLKLGPALKIFNHVKKLQTRRHFPNF